MIGIRREDKNEWERRTPLTPAHVARLAREHGVGFRVQCSEKRAFTEPDYEAAGARTGPDLDDCDVIMGIKEVPEDKLQAGKTYVYFSHTAKGQAYNMPMLRRLLDLGCTLIDYELIVDEQGRRLVFFGEHAGYAGMIDALWVLGRRLVVEGTRTPFEDLRPAHAYSSLDEARRHIAGVGAKLSASDLPPGLRPLVIGVTGTGNVSRGVQEIIDLLPVTEVAAVDLERVRDGGIDTPVCKAVFDLPERFRRSGGGEVTLAEVAEHPERFENGMLRWLPHVNLLVNGMFWTRSLPPLLTLEDMKRAWGTGELSALRVIADISCDIDGAIEATVKATTPDNPVYVYDVELGRAVDGFEGKGPVILAVDNLPAELPRESSHDFGQTLLGLVPPLDRCDWSRPLEELDLPGELSRAIITHQGRLTPDFAHLSRHLGRQG